VIKYMKSQYKLGWFKGTSTSSTWNLGCFVQSIGPFPMVPSSRYVEWSQFGTGPSKSTVDGPIQKNRRYHVRFFCMGPSLGYSL
jgi:hypothetical protein